MILRRILEPILLGSFSNAVVSFIFNPDSVKLQWDEWIAACILSVPITELNRYIDQRLDTKYDWIEFPGRRFAIHFLLTSVCLVISLNVLGILYMWIRQHGFFTVREYIIIDVVTLCLAMLMTFINWSVHFYDRWRNAEATTSQAFKLAEDLRKQILLETHLIELQKGTGTINVEPKSIHLATIEHGTVRVHFDKESYGVFPGTLSQLSLLLPDHLFFQVTRDAILHREIIKTVAASTFGKIDLTILDRNNAETAFTVSRPKAAAFRRWYNSSSIAKA